VGAKEFSMPSSVRLVDSLPPQTLGGGDYLIATNVRNENNSGRQQIEPLTAGIVIGLEDAITDKAQPPGLMESYRPSVRLLSPNKTGSPNPVAEQTREVFFDQSMVCARHAARRIDL
jgi:hypothetical protein